MLVLSPMRMGSDPSELPDTFWRLVKLEGENADYSGAIIDIEERSVTFSTPACIDSYPFDFELAGLRFFPAWRWGCDPKLPRSSQDKQIASAFETALHEINAYGLNQGTLTFVNRAGRPIIVLSSLQTDGIENRRWNITRFRGDGTRPKDKDGLTEAKEPAEILLLNGRVDGSPGCGGWAGTYELKNGHLELRAGMMLAGLCSGEMAAEGSMVQAAFKGELRIEKRGDQILLRDADGNARILLVPF